MLVNEILDIKPQGVLNKQGHKVFNVVDTKTGKTVKSFSGPNPKNAMGQAEQFRDDENKKIKKAKKANKTNNKTNKPEKTPKPDAKKPGMVKSTAKGLGKKLLTGARRANPVLAIILVGNATLVTYADGYINNYIDNNYSDIRQPDVEDSDRYVKAMAYYKLQLGKTMFSWLLTTIDGAIVAVKGGQAVNKSIAVIKNVLLAVPGLGWAGWLISGIIQLIAAGAFWFVARLLLDLKIKLQDPKMTRGVAEWFATRVFAPNLIAHVAGVPGVTSGRLESIQEDRYMVVEKMEVPTDLIKKAKAIFKKKVPKDKWKEIKAR